ncbi:hypothetical protein EDD16DRAFT_1700094 [Pisolithus croceorrhizus]|nr:hypothetical protein EDD16DRAFT_1700094 [Pisolithus croceorrhizus]
MPSSSSQQPDGVPPSPPSPSDDELSLPISAPLLPLLSSASTSTKALHLPAPPPVFVLPSHQHLAQDAGAMPHCPQPPTCKLDVFDVMNNIQLNEEVNLSSLGSSQK